MMDDLLHEFLTETAELLAEVDVELVRFEKDSNDREILQDIFRLVHTIKGTSGFLGLGRLQSVTHAGEYVLGKFRNYEMEVTPEAVTMVLKAIDRIRHILAELEETGFEPSGDDSDLIAMLRAMADGQVPAVAKKASVTAVAEKAGAPVAARSIRVNVALLESLMTLVSEMVLSRNQLLQMVRGQDDSEFAAPLQRLSLITSDLQEAVMKTRMQPIGNAWSKLPRIVRDLALETEKKIDLQMHGAETELDRQVLEMIKDPLTHMVRNSADHGLESPAERRATGKPETGAISLNAFHEGGHIIIEIADDGRGLNMQRIKAKALENNMSTEAEMAGMTEQQIQRFIMKPGFSTAEKITGVSGRGVGLDVVRSNIEKIGGTIEIKSRAGQGTTFIIKIPLTLAIVPALIVECGGQRFAIPQISVVELVCASPKLENSVETINEAPVLRLRDRLLPLVSLADLLELNETKQDLNNEVFIVVIQVGAYSFGILVDRVLDTEEIVVKPVARILRHIPYYAGNTVLGDGRVIMILDPHGIACTTGVSAAAQIDAEAATAKDVTSGADPISLLIFRAGNEELKAVPLALVARLEEIEVQAIEYSQGVPMVQYRGHLMPLVMVENGQMRTAGRQPILVFTEGGRSMGLVVDQIVDIVEDAANVELVAEQDGLIGSAVIGGKATTVIDAGHYLTQAFHHWFGRSQSAAGDDEKSFLLVDDNAFVQPRGADRGANSPGQNDRI